MSSSFLLLVVFISGYVLVINTPNLRYRFKRTEGWGAYFFVTTYGAVIAFFAWIITSLLGIVGFNGWLANVLGITRENIPNMIPITSEEINTSELKLLLWAIVSPLLSSALCLLVYLWYRVFPENKISVIAKNASQDPLEALVVEAMAKPLPICVTLSSKKVYVGMVCEPALEHGKIEFISVIPLMSGYRDKDTLNLNLTTNYRNHYHETDIYYGGSNRVITDYRVVIPSGEVEHISLFDFATYADFKRAELNEGENNTHPPQSAEESKE